ncbi:MAG: TonB-dependent receptor [Akkermansiaceae bacterium]|nr:TonB-dependent receptor [Akkermansiaceae bacterium]
MAITSLDKALELNLDPGIYGTFAEIGAGQETANWFFRASGTAGLVAKSISAYDMVMSDALYGHSSRYVSCERLEAMLNHEYAIQLERLAEKRGKETTFFSFCNTVRARGYNDDGECHGWVGLRFQTAPGAEPTDIVMHLRLLDRESIDQMEALGLIGLNLIHSAFFNRANLKSFIESLLDGLSSERVEIDMLRFSGQNYDKFDNRLCALQLVKSGLTDATMFLPNGEVVQPAEALYKRPVLLLRGSFDPVLNLHMSMIEQSREGFAEQLKPDERDKVVELCEITMANLLRGEEGMGVTDFLNRADALQKLGKTVLVSRCAEFHRIAAFLHRCTTSSKGIILSIGLLNELFKKKWSKHLQGGLLESFGRLFKEGLTLWVFPWKNRKSGELVTAETFVAPENSKHLYSHFMENGRIHGVECQDEALLTSTGRDVNRMIVEGLDEWKQLVPEEAWEMAERHARR